MASDNLKAVGFAAGLSPDAQKKLDDFQKSLGMHQTLINMPQDAAQAKYQKLTPAQQADLVKNFGNEDPTIAPTRSPLGTAWHYTGGMVGAGIGKLFAGFQNVSDVMTRAWRAGQIAGDQGVSLGDAWTIANDKGDKVFSPDRITDAKIKFGNDAIDVAMRIASGEKPGVIMASATPEQQKYLMLADPTNKVIPGIPNDKIEAARANFQDAQDAVNAAKYSPGRYIANLVTPSQLEGSGLFYKAVSGAVDAAYRVLADPLLAAGKVKRFYDVSHYAVDVVLGSTQKAEKYFSDPKAINFWNAYGNELSNLTKAQTARSPEAIEIAQRNLSTLAPQFGPEVIQAFQKSKIPVTNADSAKAFFENQQQVVDVMAGSIGRQRVLMPRLDAARKARIAAVTTGRKVFNLDSTGPGLVDNYFFGGATTSDGIAEVIINNQKEFVNNVTAKTNFKGIARFSMNYIQHKIDRAKAAATPVPIFENEVWSVKSPDAANKIYQLARFGGLPEYESKMISIAFDNIEDVGTRKNIYNGLWSTLSEIRGANSVAPGQQVARYVLGKAQAVFGDDAYSSIGSMPSDFNEFVTAPGIKDLDRIASRNVLFQKLFGIANSELANKMMSAWSFLTLAGPRYAIRNAGEDLMVNLAIGRSPWGLAKEYQLNSRINTFLQAAKEAEGGHNWANNPLGIILRVTNRREINNVKAELTAIKNKFDTGRKDIATLKKQLSEFPAGHPDIDATRAKLEDAIAGMKGGFDKQVQEVFAGTLTAGRLNRWREQLGMKPMNNKEAEILKEHIRYGNLERASEDVSEGGMNMFTGNDYVTRSENLVKQTGVQAHALTFTNPDIKMAKKPGERAFDFQALNQRDEGAMVSWMLQISRYANDELAGIAIANLDNKATAIKKMVNWMNTTKQGKQFLSDSRLSDKLSAEEIANINFGRSKQFFIKRNGDINFELLSKVRAKNEAGDYIISGHIGLDDLPKGMDDIPPWIIGPTLVPAVEAERMTSTIVQRGWTFLGLSNSRMSRQPIVLDEIVKIRKQFKKSGFEDKWIESYQRGIDPTDVAKMSVARENALKELTNVVEERAIQQTLAYVDNPLVRSQLSWNLRNFARFYRATEDFYRRVYRVVKYNPEALVKLSLTYEGVTHSGWIQQDDQGQSYFVYPGISTTYNSVQKMLDRMGIAGEFKIPMPVNFGANIKMLTPSLNQDSIFPTFSGPVAALPVTVVTQLVNIWNPGAADTIKGYAMGKYAVDQPILSAFLPAHINRALALMSTDDRNSQYASAYRKSVTYLEAAGHGIPEKRDEKGNLIPPTAQELETYRQQIKSTTLGILGLRFMFGFFAPASPQVQLKSDMAQWVSDNGRANFKQAWNDLAAQYPGDYNAAMAKWVQLYPNQTPFTLTETEKNSVASFRYAKESGEFVNANKGLFNKYPLAAAFLIPHKSGFSFDAYKTMKDMGLITNKRVEDYLLEVQTAADTQTYYAKKREFDDALSSSLADFERTDLRQQFDAWKKVFFAGHPLVADELSKAQQKSIDRLRALDELTIMLQAKPNVMPKTEAGLLRMVNLYQKYKNDRADLELVNGSNELIKILKTDTLSKMQELANFNENTKAAYDTIFSTLLGD